MYVQQTVRINAKLHCMSIKGVNLWNNCSERMKTRKTLSEFKHIFKNNVMNRYRMDERRDGIMYSSTM